MNLQFIKYGPVAVTILANRFWPDNYGGIERHMWHTATGFADRGLHTRVIAENRTQSPSHESPRPNLTIQRVPPLDPGRLWRWREWVRIAWWRRIVSRHTPAGMIWASEPNSAAATISAGRTADLIYNPAGCGAAMHLVSRRYPFVTSMRVPRGQILIERFAYRMAPFVVVSSDNVAQQLEQHYGRRRNVHVVPHGAQPKTPVDRTASRQRWGLSKDDFVIGFVGRLDPCKDLGFLFEAFALSRIHNGRLLLIGDGPDRSRLEQIARQKNIADRITWTGKLDDTGPGYAAMDAMVLPSVYEAYGNVVPEAMALGVPVLGRRRDGSLTQPVLTAMSEMIADGKTGFVVDPHDPSDLAQRLTEMADSPELTNRLSENARRASRGNSSDRMIRGYQCLLTVAGIETSRAA